MARTIGLPQELYLQITRLADQLGISIVDLVSQLVRAAIKASHLPQEVPGWIIKPAGREVLFECSGAGIRRHWTPEAARQVATALEALSLPASTAKQPPAAGTDLKLERCGPGLRILCSRTGASPTVARCVAAELASLLRGAADAIQA